MRTFIVLASALAVANAGLIATPLAAVAGASATQYHAQDELGQYSYGYAGGPSSKAESKTADGVVRGAYSYIDGNGLVQSVNYVADPVNGFRVAATNLPVGPAPVAAVAAPALVAAPAPVLARAALPAPVLARAALPVAPLAHHHIAAAHVAAPAIAVGPATYHAAAAPLNNGAYHVASLPVAPSLTPEVAAATIQHLNAKAAIVG